MADSVTVAVPVESVIAVDALKLPIAEFVLNETTCPERAEPDTLRTVAVTVTAGALLTELDDRASVTPPWVEEAVIEKAFVAV